MRAAVTGLSPLLIVCATAFAVAQPRAPFHLQEATVAGIRDAFANGRLTCAQLTRHYLDRIEAYNLRGPALRAIITVNSKTLETAAELDRRYTGESIRCGSAALYSHRHQG